MQHWLAAIAVLLLDNKQPCALCHIFNNKLAKYHMLQVLLYNFLLRIK